MGYLPDDIDKITNGRSEEVKQLLQAKVDRARENSEINPTLHNKIKQVETSFGFLKPGSWNYLLEVIGTDSMNYADSIVRVSGIKIK